MVKLSEILFGSETDKTLNEGLFEKPPVWLYHATNEDNALEIAYTGKLTPHRPDFGTDQHSWPDGNTERRSYFGTSADDVSPFYPEFGKPVLLRIPGTVAKFRKEKGTPDWYTTQSLSTQAIEYYDTAKKLWTPISSLQHQHPVTVQ